MYDIWLRDILNLANGKLVCRPTSPFVIYIRNDECKHLATICPNTPLHLEANDFPPDLEVIFNTSLDRVEAYYSHLFKYIGCYGFKSPVKVASALSFDTVVRW